MRYLHTMVRVSDLDQALGFYCGALGLEEVSRFDDLAARILDASTLHVVEQGLAAEHTAGHRVWLVSELDKLPTTAPPGDVVPVGFPVTSWSAAEERLSSWTNSSGR